MLNRKINELQSKISVADTQRIAQNHEIEQLKVTMALMIKSQEKLELKNKELEEQIKEATDRQNQHWWQRS
jgi:regulator of replication initiation timing